MYSQLTHLLLLITHGVPHLTQQSTVFMLINNYFNVLMFIYFMFIYTAYTTHVLQSYMFVIHYIQLRTTLSNIVNIEACMSCIDLYVFIRVWPVMNKSTAVDFNRQKKGNNYNINIFILIQLKLDSLSYLYEAL